MTDDLRTGTTEGLDWIEMDDLEARTVKWHLNARGPRGADRVRIFHPPGNPPRQGWIDHFRTKPANYGYSIRGDIGFRPFDEMELGDGCKITYDKDTFEEFDVMAWARSRIDIPDTIDMHFTFEPDRARLAAHARTVRNGREVVIRRKVGTDLPFREAMVDVISYFVKNCPKPATGAVAAVTCGEHLNAVFEHLTDAAWDRVDAWTRSMAAAEIGDRSAFSLMLPPMSFTSDIGIEQMDLIASDKSNGLLATMKLSGGHTLKDDEIGTTIGLASKFPDTIVNAMKGRRLSEVIEAPWARSLTIRSARDVPPKDKFSRQMIVIRAVAPGTAASLPPRPVTDEAAAIEKLKSLTLGENLRWKHFEETARPVLEAMSPTTLATVLALLSISDDCVRLDEHGFPGWSLTSYSNKVSVRWSPEGDMGALVKAKIGEE